MIPHVLVCLLSLILLLQLVHLYRCSCSSSQTLKTLKTLNNMNICARTRDSVRSVLKGVHEPYQSTTPRPCTQCKPNQILERVLGKTLPLYQEPGQPFNKATAPVLLADANGLMLMYDRTKVNFYLYTKRDCNNPPYTIYFKGYFSIKSYSPQVIANVNQAMMGVTEFQFLDISNVYMTGVVRANCATNKFVINQLKLNWEPNVTTFRSGDELSDSTMQDDIINENRTFRQSGAPTCTFELNVCAARGCDSVVKFLQQHIDSYLQSKPIEFDIPADELSIVCADPL